MGETGTYDFTIEYIGESASKLLVCTTDGGMWIGTGESDNYYGGITVNYDKLSDCYYSIENNKKGGKVYIDFVHYSYFASNQTLYELITKYNKFDYSSSGGGNFTGRMLDYYYKSIEGKSEQDELYGMVEANQELVSMLDDFFTVFYNGSYDSEQYAWLAFACYYANYGPQN
jgi:hypothetical protein